MKDLQDDIQFLKGVGEKRSFLLRRLGIQTMGDLMEFFPRTYINRKTHTPISELRPGQMAAVVGSIMDIDVRQSLFGKRQLNVMISDGRSSLLCTWFRYSNWLIDELKPNHQIWVSGMVSEFMGRMQIIHPEYEVLDENQSEGGFWQNRSVLPVYPLTENLKMKAMRNLILQVFSSYAKLIEETLPSYILERFQFQPRSAALQKMHFTQKIEEVPDIRRRFIFEEFLYSQLMWARSQYHQQHEVPGIEMSLQKTYTSSLKASLPFTLTNAQKRVITEIITDMQTPKPMQRLLQGDVGSGKTIVTLFAMLLAVENGYQAILMAPTEILAEQHYRNLQNLLSGQNDIQICMLKGGSYKGKSDVKTAIANGLMHLIVGTHALLQKDVTFHRVGFVAIDEQHRFGVEQRAELHKKTGMHPHLLYMSATPIPRSLAMSVFGDLEVSKLDEMPPNRKVVKTLWRTEAQKKEVYSDIYVQLKKGRQVYIVCPLIEESEKIDLLDAETLYQKISTDIFPLFKSALLHGRMKNEEKNAIMSDFKSGKTQILVSTTVIEVGVDVANATVMMIEHAERFGLAQLHQLRGRVGRGAEESYCYLISYIPISNVARQRLDIMEQTNDGFLIAEKDLDLRGPGEMFGREQSGLPNFKHANLVRDQHILVLARKEAFAIIADDYHLEKPENAPLRKKYDAEYLTREKLIEY